MYQPKTFALYTFGFAENPLIWSVNTSRCFTGPHFRHCVFPYVVDRVRAGFFYVAELITRGKHVSVTVVCQAAGAEVFGSCTNACTFPSPCPQTSSFVGSGIRKSQGAVRTVEGERREHRAWPARSRPGSHAVRLRAASA